MKKILLSTITIATISMAGEGSTPVDTKNSFLDRIHLKNDLRLRYESIERDDKSDKYRNRYRLRLGAKVDLTDELKLEAGMRSGFANPTSGNQTFHDDEPLKDYFLQSLRVNTLGLSYELDNSTIKIGRQPYMMYRPLKSQLVWDNDISLNGINYQYQDDTKIVTLGLNQPTLEEASVARDDINLILAQYVHKTKLGDAKLNVGTGIYYYDGLKGNTAIFGSSKGNTLVNHEYANDYHIAHGFSELQFKDIFGKPLKMAASVAYNISADDNNLGYDLAVKLGKAKKVGDWQVKYSYTVIEADAVLGAYSDSDNFGGGTAAHGHAIRAKYKMGKELYIAGNFFFNELDESKSKVKGMEPKYERVQLDCIVKF